jgi:hypothetical protein
MGDPTFRAFAAQVSAQVELTSTASGVLLALFLAAKGVARLTKRHTRVSGALDVFADVIGESVAFFAATMANLSAERRL